MSLYVEGSSQGSLCMRAEGERWPNWEPQTSPWNGTRKAAAGSESIAHHRTTQVRTLLSLPFALFVGYCSSPGWVETAAWTMRHDGGERRS